MPDNYLGAMDPRLENNRAMGLGVFSALNGLKGQYGPRKGMIEELMRQKAHMKLAPGLTQQRSYMEGFGLPSRFNEPQRPSVAQYEGVTSDDLASILSQSEQQSPNLQYEGVTSDQVAAEQPKTYQIKRGDTLSEIAQKMGVSVQQLAEANNIDDVNKIYAGDTLRIG